MISNIAAAQNHGLTDCTAPIVESQVPHRRPDIGLLTAALGHLDSHVSNRPTGLTIRKENKNQVKPPRIPEGRTALQADSCVCDSTRDQKQPTSLLEAIANDDRPTVKQSRRVARQGKHFPTSPRPDTSDSKAEEKHRAKGACFIKSDEG